ncbi:hypothetical protein FI667_g1873, partial [Globisporangium splendens]
MTLANLLLPELNTPGALDFELAIRIDSSVPVVRKVTLSSDIARAVSTSLVVQTIDVFNQVSLTQSEFKLVYGGNSGDTRHETTCLDWNMAATSLESALEAISGLVPQVNVAKDTSTFHDGHRYVITSTFPSMGLQSLRVKVKTNGDGCQAFACGTGALVPCTLSSVVNVNLNADMTYRPGVLDALVEFSVPVAVTGTPQLALETVSMDTQALYTTRSTLLEFDVGTEAASPILRGSFRLFYGDFSASAAGVGTIRTTERIDIPPVHKDTVQELSAKLEAAVPELVTIGITAITRCNLRNGYRYRITMRYSPDLLDLVPTDASACTAFAGRRQAIDIVSTGARILQGESTQPRVLRVTSTTPNGTYHPGDTITLQIVFSLPVLVFGSPTVRLETGRMGAFATYTEGNETTTLTFTYAIVIGDQCATLEVHGDRNGDLKLNYVKSLDLTHRAQILRLSTAVHTNALPAPGESGSLSTTKTLCLDSVQPTIIDVRLTTLDRTYDVGEVVEILVEFSRNVVVVGIPLLILNVAGIFDRTAIYESGSGTSVLRFAYLPVAGDSTHNTPLNLRDSESLILKPLLAGREFMGRPAQV